jgi:hypothetical protein
VLTSAYHSDGDFAAELARVEARLACGEGEGEGGGEGAGEGAGGGEGAGAGEGEGAGAGEGAGGGDASSAPPPPPRLCLRRGRYRMPPVHLLSAVPQADLAGVYASVDALVQPSRGEGWGRPHAEAMAMALPVVATAWGGPAAFLDAQSGFPLNWTHLARAPGGAFAGHRFAEPDARALARTLARIRDDPADARARGARAREKMLRLYAPETVAAYAAHLAAEALAAAATDRRTDSEELDSEEL